MSEENQTQTQPVEQAIDQDLAALLGARDQAQDQNAALTRANAELAQRLATLEAALHRGVKTPAPSIPKPAVAPKADSVDDDIESRIEAAISRALSPVLQQSEANTKQAQLKQAQAQSFGQAATKFPDLADDNTALYKLTAQLFERVDDFKNSPRGPLLAALAARGELAQRGAAQLITDERKRALAPPVSRARSPIELANRAVKDVKNATEEVTARIAEKGHATAEDFANIFRARLTQMSNTE